MKNSIVVFNSLLLVVYIVLIFTTNYLITFIYGAILIFWFILSLPYFQKLKWVQKIFDGFYKLSFPYTTDDVIILNCMQVVNWFIGKRFQILYYFELIEEPELKITDKTIFYDDFNTFKEENWDKRFPWGEGNNVPWNIYVENNELITKMQKENYRGWWDGWKDFHTTVGVIYSKNIFPANGYSYEAKIKLSKINYINQNFWLLRLTDPPLKRAIEEIDIFEYHLSEGNITMSQHWGNCYSAYNHFPDLYHRQDSFSIKVDLAKDDKYHVFKYKQTKRNMYWYIDGVLVKWHFLGVPKLEQHIVSGMGNVNNGIDVTDTGKLNLDELPAYMKCKYIKIDKN